MGFRFWRRKKIFPGVTLNMSKSGLSVSFGPRGCKFTVGKTGGQFTAGIPGTGLFYTKKVYSRGKGGAAEEGSDDAAPAPPPAPHSPAEQAFTGAGQALVEGNESAALAQLGPAEGEADGAFLAGFLALKAGQLEQAERCLRFAADHEDQLGQLFERFDMAFDLELPITDEVNALVEPNARGALLGLVEVYQLQERYDEAIGILERLRRLEPHDVVIKLSLMELQAAVDPRWATWQNLADMSKGIDNDSAVHAGVLLYRGRALHQLGQLVPARDALTAGLRKRKDRRPELLRALRYERALVYEALGQKARCRDELKKIHDEQPDFMDVAERLGR